jgi:tetratricopeptide (TPR) repeat protein
MSQQAKQGIPRQGLGASFEGEEAHKSRLILEARLLRERHDDDQAALRFAEAAQIEERLGDIAETKGLLEKARVHRFSAASCWAQAGNFYRAIGLCDDLLAYEDLSERLRRRVLEYADTLRARRAEWYAGLALELTTGELG